MLAALWEARAAEVAKTAFKDDGHVVLPTDTNDVSSYTEIYVHLGEVIRIPVDETTVSVKVGYSGERKTQTTTKSRRVHAAMCRMLSFCSVDDDFSIDLSHTKTLLQLSYIEIAISKRVPVLFNGKQSI
ncbi:MAG: hypothetical protein M3H12_01525, partial [Chromatiales bacterium]